MSQTLKASTNTDSRMDLQQWLPNFIEEKPSNIFLSELKFKQSSPVKRMLNENQWYNDLHIFKRQTTSEKKFVNRVMEGSDVTADLIDQTLEFMEPVVQDIGKLRKQLQDVCDEHAEWMRNEKEQKAGRDKVLSSQDWQVVRERRHQAMVHMRNVKRQIAMALRQAEEEARLRKDLEVEAKRQAEMRAREQAWKVRNQGTNHHF